MAPLRWLLVALLAVTYGINESHPAKILMYMGMSSPSHKFAFLTYVDGLLAKGHQVTFISPFPTKGAKFRDITPKLLQESLTPLLDLSFVDIKLNNDMWTFWKIFPQQSYSTCEALLKSPEVQDIVTGKDKYDLVVLDTLAPECGMGFALVQDAPLIYYSTTVMLPWNSAAFGLGTVSIYKTDHFTFYRRDVRNFFDRAMAVISNTLYEWRRQYCMFPAVEELWKNHLGRPVGSFFEIEKNMSLMLLNTHPLLDHPVPYTANIISVGGIHFMPLKALPKELDEFVSGSGDKGFVLVSLGSIVQSKTLPEKYYNAYVEAFKRLPFRIVWKWEADAQRKKLSSNVMITNWVPQHELLAHPKIKGFVTHGGKLGMMEATKEGVPVVVVPFFSDQDMHARKAHDGGFGIHLDLRDVTADSLYNALMAITTDPSFKETAIKRARILEDQPDTPLSRAIYWTEFVLRHPEGPDSRPLCIDFWWFQYHMIDVWMVIILILLVPVIVAVLLVRCLCRSIIGKKNNITPKKVKAS